MLVHVRIKRKLMEIKTSLFYEAFSFKSNLPSYVWIRRSAVAIGCDGSPQQFGRGVGEGLGVHHGQ